MPERAIHLRDYLDIIRKHKFVIIISFLLVFGSALITALYLPRVYETTAVIEIQSSSQSSGISSLVQNVILPSGSQSSLETISRRFTSNSFLYQTIRNIRKRMPEIGEKLGEPEHIAPKIRTRIIPEANMIELTISMRRDEGGSQRAALVTNELISVMQTYNEVKNNSEIIKRQEFIDGKIDKIEDEIGESDQDLRNFLKNNGDTLVWSAQADYLMTRLSNLLNIRESNETLLEGQKKKLDNLNRRLKEVDEWQESSRTLSKDSLWEKSRIELVDLEKSLVSAQESFGENNPEIKSLEAQIEKVKQEMRDSASREILTSKTEARNPIYIALLNQAIDAELNFAVIETRLEVVNRLINELEQEKERLFTLMPGSQYQLGIMRREVNYNVGLYRLLLEKKLEAEIWASENSDKGYDRIRGGIEIVDSAQPNAYPVSPRVNFIAAISAMIGVAVGLAMAFLFEYFETTYQSPEDASEDLGIPIMGLIPFIDEYRSDEMYFPVIDTPMSMEAESFRTLMTNIEFSGSGNQYKSIFVTSSSDGEGKSIIAANLAVSMAHAGNKVILLDCDMRKGSQHDVFRLDNQEGLSNALVGNADLSSVINNTGVEKLDLLTCGPVPPNPVELLKSNVMDEILENLKSSYDFIICDGPPVLPVADSLVLASRLDGILFVCDIKRISRDAVKQAKERLENLNAVLLGLVCSKVNSELSSSYYHRKKSRISSAS